MGLNYYHQKVNIRVISRIAQRLKTQSCRKLGNSQKISKMLANDGQAHNLPPEKQKAQCYKIEKR